MISKKEQSVNNPVIRSLQERAKELRCIYEFEELFKKYEDKPLKDFFIKTNQQKSIKLAP